MTVCIVRLLLNFNSVLYNFSINLYTYSLLLNKIKSNNPRQDLKLIKTHLFYLYTDDYFAKRFFF